MGNVKNTPTKEELIADLQYEASKPGKLTRAIYRMVGKYGDKWSKHFPTWNEFINAAGIIQEPKKPTELSGAIEEEEKQEFVGDSWAITLPNTDIHTLDQLLEYCKVDLSIWRVERFVVNKWAVGAKDFSKIIRVTPLYQVKATLVKRQEIIDAKAEIDSLKEEFKKKAIIKLRVLKDSSKLSGNLLEVNIPDPHFGKMSWGKETGGRNYDTPIAAETYTRAVDTLLSRVQSYKFDRVLFIVGNDLINSDDEQGRTTKGTFVTTDGRYQKTFVTVRKTITATIEKLRQIAPVEVLMVRGNHDNLGVWHLGDSLECLYANTEDVTINNEPSDRKYFRHGKVLLGFCHGDKGKRDNYPLLMATERSKDFGETLFREIHTGHIHQTQLQEWNGVRVRILPSLSPPDAWHSENHFVGQQRNAEAFVWNDKQGLIAMYFHNDDAFPEINTKRTITKG